MKTSFYFIIWTIIYPILGLFNSSFIDSNSFLIALLAVWGLSWLLNRLMPETIRYERSLRYATIMEDVVEKRFDKFAKRVGRDAMIETINACYFIVSTVVILIGMIYYDISTWLPLAVFGMLSIGAIARSVKLITADSKLKSNLTYEQCGETLDRVYGLDINAYAETRETYSLAEIYASRPRHFKAFQISSIIIAVVAAILGVVYLILGATLFLPRYSIEGGAIGSMMILYGVLAVYFGVKDTLETYRSIKLLHNIDTPKND